jgi:hypothetical protein
VVLFLVTTVRTSNPRRGGNSLASSLAISFLKETLFQVVGYGSCLAAPLEQIVADLDEATDRKDPAEIEEEFPRCEMKSTVALSTSKPNQITGR